MPAFRLSKPESIRDSQGVTASAGLTFELQQVYWLTLGPVGARLFFRSGNLLCMVVLAVTVQGRPDAQEKLEGVAEIVAIVAVERIGAVVDGELGAETDVDAFAVRQVADVTERVSAHWKNFGFIRLIENEFVPGFLHAFPAKVNRVAATLVI